MSVEQTHEQKETIHLDIFEPGHEPRVETSVFRTSKEQLIKLLGGADEVRCFICNGTRSEVGPLEAHHVFIERSFTNFIDWHKVKAFFLEFESDLPLVQALADSKHTMLKTLHAMLTFDWKNFDPHSEDQAYTFVDSMLANGLLLCKKHHTGEEGGIHHWPLPVWIVQKFCKEGVKLTPDMVIHDFT